MIRTVLYTNIFYKSERKERIFYKILQAIKIASHHIGISFSEEMFYAYGCSEAANSATEIPASFAPLNRDLYLRCLGALGASSNSSVPSKFVKDDASFEGVLKAKCNLSAKSACHKNKESISYQNPHRQNVITQLQYALLVTYYIRT